MVGGIGADEDDAAIFGGDEEVAGVFEEEGLALPVAATFPFAVVGSCFADSWPDIQTGRTHCVEVFKTPSISCGRMVRASRSRVVCVS